MPGCRAGAVTKSLPGYEYEADSWRAKDKDLQRETKYMSDGLQGADIDLAHCIEDRGDIAKAYATALTRLEEEHNLGVGGGKSLP